MGMEEGFLRSLHERPDEDASWLVLCDWLEENGFAERAELHRLRHQLLRMADEPCRAEIEVRVRALLADGTRPCVPELVNSIGMRFALIPRGQFMMGSPEDEPERDDDEGPRHLVILTRSFYLGVYPVTQEEYEKVTGTNPSQARSGKPEEVRRRPVEMISYNDALAFCAKLGELPPEKESGRSYTLPTEAQWEYACRAGICCSAYHFGPTLNKRQAVYLRRRPCSVGRYPPNAFGLFDMHGNIWEWCLDRYSARAYRKKPRVDPTGSKQGSDRVLRGGDWSSRPGLARSADRGRNSVDARHDYNGFRVVLQVAAP